MTIEEQSKKGRVVVLDIEMEVGHQHFCPSCATRSCSRAPRWPFSSATDNIQGVKQIKQAAIPARFVFIAPPSEAVLEQRLRGRGTESESSVQKRLAQAKKELEYARTPGVHDKTIVNDDLEAAYQQLEDWVYKEGRS